MSSSQSDYVCTDGIWRFRPIISSKTDYDRDRKWIWRSKRSEEQKRADRERDAKRKRLARTPAGQQWFTQDDIEAIRRRLASSSATAVNNITSCRNAPALIDLTMDNTSSTSSTLTNNSDLISIPTEDQPTSTILEDTEPTILSNNSPPDQSGHALGPTINSTIIPTEDHLNPASNILEDTEPPSNSCPSSSPTARESYKDARRMREKRNAEIWAHIKREMDKVGEKLMEGVIIDPLKHGKDRRLEWKRMYRARKRAKIRAYKKKDGTYVEPKWKSGLLLGELLDTVEENRAKMPKFRFTSEYWRKMRNITLLRTLKDRNRQLEKELAEERRRADKAVEFLEEIESQFRAAL